MKILKSTTSATTFEEWIILAEGRIHPYVIKFLEENKNLITFDTPKKDEMAAKDWIHISNILVGHALSVIESELYQLTSKKNANRFVKYIRKHQDSTSYSQLLDELMTEDTPTLIHFVENQYALFGVVENVFTKKIMNTMKLRLKAFNLTFGNFPMYRSPKVSFSHHSVLKGISNCDFSIHFGKKEVYLSCNFNEIRRQLERDYLYDLENPSRSKDLNSSYFPANIKNRKMEALEEIEKDLFDFLKHLPFKIVVIEKDILNSKKTTRFIENNFDENHYKELI